MGKPKKFPTISVGQQCLLWEIYESEKGYIKFETQKTYAHRTSYNKNIRVLLFSDMIKRRVLIINECFVNVFELTNDSYLVLKEWLWKLKKGF